MPGVLIAPYSPIMDAFQPSFQGGGGSASSSGGVGRRDIVPVQGSDPSVSDDDVTKASDIPVVDNPYVPGSLSKINFGNIAVDITGNKTIDSVLSKLLKVANANNVALADYNNANSYVSWDEYTKFNHDEAELNRQFQKEMSDTALDRYVEQLERNGFNKLLALGGAPAGASTPSGAQATASQQHMFGAQSSESVNKVMAIASVIGMLLSEVNNAFKFGNISDYIDSLVPR